jgi:hypothetical protein
MESEHYHDLYNYISTQQIPTYFTKEQKRQLLNQTKNYTIENELLYKMDRKDAQKLYRII